MASYKNNVRVFPGVQRLRSAEDSWFILKGSFDIPFFILVLTLLGIGLIMLFSASHANALYYTGSSYAYIYRQLLIAIAGVVFMIVISFFNYRKLHYFAFLSYIVSVALLCVTHFMPARQGAQRWIIIGGHQFQPSELAKVALVIFMADMICRFGDRMGEFKIGTLMFLAILGGIALPLVTQPHLSATIIVGIMSVAMMYVGGARLKHLFIVVGACLTVAALAYIFFPSIQELFAHAARRLEYWLDPFSDPQGAGYQTVQSLYAIGSGGFFGVGLGESRQKYMYLPEVQNDFVFAIVCEELGFIWAAAIIVLFALLVWRGFTIALKARDRFGSLIVIGLVTQVGVQAMLNIAVVTNTVPNTGISLPFFSYGGTALLVMLWQMGLVLSVSRQINYEKE